MKSISPAALRVTITLATTALATMVLGTPSARADETTRLSNAPSGFAGHGASADATISADGGAVAFVSDADDLVAGDTNGVADVFVLDRATGAIARVSVATGGAQSDARSFTPVLSATGRFVAFASEASNLDVDPNGAKTDVFLHDRATGATKLLSLGLLGLGGNDESFAPSIDADGGRVAFQSAASNLVAGDLNGKSDAFLWEAATGAISLISVDASGLQSDGPSHSALISGNGEVVAFYSWSSTFPLPPPTGAPALYVKDLVTGTIERLDVDSDGNADDDVDADLWPASGISDDGRFVVFNTAAELEEEDENELQDVYLRDRLLGTAERVDRSSDGEVASHGASNGKLSGDGRFLLFYSSSPDLVRGDRNHMPDVYLRDLLHQVTTRVSVGTFDEEGKAGSFTSSAPGRSISADGDLVLFQSYATEFAAGDGNAVFDVFLRERCGTPASSSHFGAGFPGRNGAIPTLTPQIPPLRGKSIPIDLSNTAGIATQGYVLVGLARASIPTLWGGTVLVDPWMITPVALAPAGGTFTAELPATWWSCGFAVEMQAAVADPWAARGLAFSDGLELLFGD